MIPDIIVVLLIIGCIVATIGLIGAGNGREKFFACIPFLILILTSTWLTKAIKTPYPITRSVECELQTIEDGLSTIQVIKDGSNVFNITQLKAQLFNPNKKIMVRVDYYNDTIYGIIFIGAPKHNLTVLTLEPEK